MQCSVPYETRAGNLVNATDGSDDGTLEKCPLASRLIFRLVSRWVVVPDSISALCVLCQPLEMTLAHPLPVGYLDWSRTLSGKGATANGRSEKTFSQ